MLAAALARRSAHPISRAVAAASNKDVALQNFTEVAGSGVEAKVEGGLLGLKPGTQQLSTVRLGSLPWLRKTGIELGKAQPFINEWSRKGATLAGLSADHELLGIFAVTDTLKPGAAEVIRQLEQAGLRTYLVTGDSKITAAAIGTQAGIDASRVFAEVRPEQKADLVRKLQEEGQNVAFIGDGINDAPALKQANLGIGVSRASDIAREAADIILLNSDIHAVPESLGLARATLRTIKQNLFWAFFYNAAGIPLAALGFMSPILCAAAMALSDLVVIGNALRLRGWRQK